VLAEAERTEPAWAEEHAAADAATDDRRVLADETRRQLASMQAELSRR
jgi:hypothetical protein